MKKVIHSKLSGSIVALTLFVAFFCEIKTINSFLAFGVAADAEEGPMAMLYLFTIVAIFMLGLLYKPRGLKVISESAIFILFAVTGLYFFTTHFIAPPYTSLPFFIVFTLVSFLVPFVAQVEPRLFFKSLMLFATPAVFYLNSVFHFVSSYQEDISMGLSYSFLMPILASIIYMFLFFKDEKGWKRYLYLIVFCINMVFAYYVISFGSRGPVFSTMCLVAFLLIVQPRISGKGVKIRRMRLLYFVLTTIFLILTFQMVLYYLQDILAEQGISFHFINKFISLDEQDNITNGREFIIKTALKEIGDSPFWGYGLDGFANHHTEMHYPHNFIVQILYDGGIMLFLILFIPLIKGLIRVFQNCTIEEYGIYTLLIFACVPPAMFSGDLWKSCTLWLLFGALLSRTFIYNAK